MGQTRAVTTTADPIIRADGVTKRWGSTTALDGLTVEVGSGITGLLGANGAGKSTFLGLLLGLHRRDAGRLELLGSDPQTAGPELRAVIGHHPQRSDLPGDLQAADLVRHIAEMHGLPRREATERASETLWLVGLGEERFRPVGTMSTGQTQRVKLAQAVAHDPDVLLLDEPTDGLDPIQRDEMLELIVRIGTELGMQVLLSSHRLGEVERICDAVVVIDEGRLSRSGEVGALRGSANGYLLDVLERGQAVVNELHAAGCPITIHGETIRVGAPSGLDDDQLADMIREVLVRTDAGVRRLVPDRLSLEDAVISKGPS